MDKSATAATRFAQPAVPAPLPPEASFDGGRLTSDGGPVVPGQRLPRTFLACAPTIAAEVLSGHDYDRWADFMAKIEDYLSAGAALVWVLSPRHDTITVYDPAGGVAGALALGAPVLRIGHGEEETLGAAVIVAAGRISASLGHRGARHRERARGREAI